MPDLSDPAARPSRRRLSPDDRRGELLAPGARVFGERPYDEVRIDEIAERAGVIADPCADTLLDAVMRVPGIPAVLAGAVAPGAR